MDSHKHPASGRAGRRRHAAGRSRVVAAALSVAMFAGLGGGMAVRALGARDAAAASSTTSATGSWSATAGTSSDQSAMTTSQGS